MAELQHSAGPFLQEFNVSANQGHSNAVGSMSDFDKFVVLVGQNPLNHRSTENVNPVVSPLVAFRPNLGVRSIVSNSHPVAPTSAVLTFRPTTFNTSLQQTPALTPAHALGKRQQPSLEPVTTLENEQFNTTYWSSYDTLQKLDLAQLNAAWPVDVAPPPIKKIAHHDAEDIPLSLPPLFVTLVGQQNGLGEGGDHHTLEKVDGKGVEDVVGLVEPVKVMTKELLMEFLPSRDVYKYKIKSFTPLEHSNSSHRTKFSLNINTREEFDEWLETFQTKTHAQFTVITSIEGENRYVEFKRSLKCLHNVRRGTLNVRKHTACPARLTVRIRSVPKRIRKDRTTVDLEFRCEIDLTWHHNHSLVTSDILRRHRVSADTERKLVHLFQHGHSPKSALQCIVMEIEDGEHDNQHLEFKLADRSIRPDYRHCHYIFKKHFRNGIRKMKRGDPQNEDRLMSVIARINEEMDDDVVAREQFQTCNILVVCTAFMKRVHERVEGCAEAVYVDSFTGVGRNAYRLYVMMAQSKAGALPIAVGITTSESVDILTHLFNLMKCILPSYSFYSRGVDQGPNIFLIDDSAELSIALSNVWPQSRVLLCPFRFLRAQWQWICLDSHGVDPADRPALFAWVKRLLNASNETVLNVQYEWFQYDPLVVKNTRFRDQMNALYNKKDRWSAAARGEASLLETNVSNDYLEMSMRLLKDQIFHRTRLFNVVQILHFLSDHFTSFYERRLLDYALDRPHRGPAVVFPAYEGQVVQEVSEDVYEVASSKGTGAVYTVNIAAVTCTCFLGLTGKMCKHLHYVYLGINCHLAPKVCSRETKKLMHFVAAGFDEPTEQPVKDDGQEDEGEERGGSEEDEFEKLVEEFKDLIESKIVGRCLQRPKKFVGALRVAVSALKSIRTNTGALSALHNLRSWRTRNKVKKVENVKQEDCVDTVLAPPTPVLHNTDTELSEL